MSPRLRFGVVGLSSDHVWMMGDGLAAQPDAELVTSADADPGLLGRAAQRWDLARTYPACGDLLAAGAGCRAGLLATTAGKDADVVGLAASRGVHVYMDKPMAATLDRRAGCGGRRQPAASA